MRIPIIADLRDKKFKILKKAVKKLEKDGVKESLARNGIKPIDEAIVMLKILLASLFFRLELSYFVEELKKRRKLRELMNVSEVPDIKEVYDFMAKMEEESFRKAVEHIINLFGKIGRGCFKIVVDTSGIDLNLNKQKNRKSNEELENKDYKWGFNGNKYFIGFKLAFAMDYKACPNKHKTHKIDTH